MLRIPFPDVGQIRGIQGLAFSKSEFLRSVAQYPDHDPSAAARFTTFP
jgi:hypothetical protein